jgi:hypothetical protein
MTTPILEITGSPITLTAYPDEEVLTIRQAVIAFLNSLPALTTIVGTRIYDSNPSQLSTYPCVTVTLTKRTYTNNLSGFAGASLATFEMGCLALVPARSVSVAIAEVIRNNYQGFQGVQSGVAVLRCLLDEESDDTFENVDGSDNWIYETPVTYEIYHRVPMPTSVTQTHD